MRLVWGKTSIPILLSICIVMLSISTGGAEFAEQRNLIQPPSSLLDTKYRLGYSETDPYVNFAGTLYAIVQGLEEIGWLEGVDRLPYSPGQADSLEMWQWLATNEVSPYIEFVEDAHYSLIEPNREEALLQRLAQQDLDLMLVMGTAAGQTVVQANHQVPTMVFSTSNAVQAGIIDSPQDSGKDHVWAHMDAERYIRQVEVFHDIFQFEKLGMMYVNSDVGRVVAAVQDVQEVAQRLDFEIVHEFIVEPESEAELEPYYQAIREAHQRLAQQVDAYYLTAGVWELEQLSNLLQPFYEQGIPVFSQIGANEVKHGALLSLYRASFKGIGRFGAENIVQVLQGIAPRDLPQVYGDTPSIVINLAVAEKIGYQTPFDILLVADEVFLDIE